MSRTYETATHSAGLIQESWMGVIVLTGSERQTWLQGMVTNEVKKLAPGEGCYAAHLNAQGKLIAQMIVLAAEDRLWLLVERAAAAHLFTAFDRLIIMEDVQVQDVSGDYDLFHVSGSDAPRILASLTGETVALNRLYEHRPIGQHRAFKSDFGYELIVKREDIDEVRKTMMSAGATAIDRSAWDILRTEAGWPLYGVDVDESTVLPELGERGISYDKGCYIGQEVVAKIKYIGHVNRKFVGLTLDGISPSAPGSPVRSGGKDVGYVTTSVSSPTIGKPIALAFVNRVAAAPGTSVEVVSGAGTISATVESLPFVTRRAG